MAKVSLIYFDITTGHAPGLHNGLASLSAVIKQAGHELRFHHLTEEVSVEALADKVLEFKPDIVGFSFVTNQRKHLDKYAEAIYRKINVLQVAGGIHATVDALDVFNVSSIFGVCIGEGERTFTDLLGRLDRGESVLDTPGFYWRTKDGIKKNPVPTLEHDLSKLPYPDY